MPSVAEPEAGVSVTTVGVVLGLVSVTAKSRLPPSVVVGLDTVPTLGVSLSGGLPGGGGAVPSSAMVDSTLPVVMVALLGVFSATVKVSLPSNSASLVMATVMVCVVWPGAKVSVPEVAV